EFNEPSRAPRPPVSLFLRTWGGSGAPRPTELRTRVHPVVGGRGMHPTLANRTARLRWLGSIPRGLWRGRRARPGSDPDAGGARAGLHAVRRPADLWFEERAAELEASAVAMAQAAAAAKLPRADVEYESVPEEEDLITRACAIFRGWTERVRTHVQDAVQRCAERADARLSDYEHE